MLLLRAAMAELLPIIATLVTVNFEHVAAGLYPETATLKRPSTTDSKAEDLSVAVISAIV
jgi:hypothetical protein